jgi:hypothetical protein
MLRYASAPATSGGLAGYGQAPSSVKEGDNNVGHTTPLMAIAEYAAQGFTKMGVVQYDKARLS